MIRPPHYFQNPNEFIDVWIKKLSDIEFKILMYISRKIFDLQNQHEKIDLTQLVKIIADDKKSILSSVNNLIEYGLIKKSIDVKNGIKEIFYTIDEVYQ